MRYSTQQLQRGPSRHEFLFATGLENSYPVIENTNGKLIRQDEYEKTRHYERWREDFRLVLEMGIRYLRYGPPSYRVHTGPGQYDWSFVDDTFGELQQLGIVPITDLCHFGLPDWIGGYQNTDWPRYFAEFAEAFARRYPWVQLYTPVNEMFVAARRSCLLGQWNDRAKSDRAFVAAIKHMAKATILAEEAILRVRPGALFVQSEASSYFHPRTPLAMHNAVIENGKRLLALDLCYGHELESTMVDYIRDHGLTQDEQRWFVDHAAPLRANSIMGNDFYTSNEHWVTEDGIEPHEGESIFGYYVVTQEYYDRYHLPVMHTETNQRDTHHEAVDWLHDQWAQIVALKQNNVPIIGFTWFSLIDQVDWDSALSKDRGKVDQVGLYSLDRKAHPVAGAYRKLIATWRETIPMEPLSVTLES